MWMEELKNGKFKYIERYKDPKTNKQKRVSVTLDSDSRQAWNRATRILNKKINNALEKPKGSNVTFGEVATEYFDYAQHALAPSTCAMYGYSYKNHVSILNDYLISKITIADIQRLVDKMQIEKKLSKSTTDTAVSVVKNILNFAESRYNIECGLNFSKLYVLNITTNDDKKKLLSKHEINKLLTELTNPVSRAIAEFQLLTGARFGEVVALTFDDVDEDSITINKSYDSITGLIGPTKNKHSNRVISSSSRIKEIVDERKVENEIAFGSKVKYIFVNSLNKPFRIKTFNTHIKQVIPGLTSHALRHTHISLLAEQGFTLRQIMDRVGHNSPDTTLTIYSHTTEDLKKQEGQKIDNLF